MHIIDQFNSAILGSYRFIDLINLCDFSFEDRWGLLYRASRDGFGSLDFHTKCDGKSPTLTILKAKQTGYIFGGYTSALWDGDEIQKFDRSAFIFSLTNKENLSCKINSSNYSNSIFCSTESGPSFGGGDIHITDNSNTINLYNSFSDLGVVFNHPRYDYGTDEVKSFFAGSYYFQLEEIEVYQKKSTPFEADNLK
jgi:hypothetical protein